MTDASAPRPPRPEPLEPGDELTAEDFGESLRRLRKWAGLSVVTLPAKVADLSRTSLSEYERAKRIPSLEIVDAALSAKIT